MWRNCWGLLSNKVMTNLPAIMLLCNCLRNFRSWPFTAGSVLAVAVCAWLWTSICAVLGPVEMLGVQSALPLSDLCTNTSEMLSPPTLFWATAVTSAAAASTKVRGSYFIDFRIKRKRERKEKKKREREREQGNESVCGVFSISLMYDISTFSFD